MAEKQISILLIAKNMASKTIGQVNKDLGRLGATGRRAGQGLRSLGANLAKIGAVAAVGIGVAVKNGIDSLVELESAVGNVDGAIAQLGLTGKIVGSQVAGWANEIEANVQAAFDDKEITAGAGALIRYGKVTEANLRPAMEVMTDLAAKTGSVESAATLLAKALADPAKAAGKLARQGVILTKAEQDQIKAFMKAGDVGKAQAVILASLEKTTKGAAAAMNGPYADAQKTLADVTEDAQRALAEGFLPVLQRVSKWLSTELAKPETIANIRSLGKTLAGAFDKAVTFVQKIPWGSVMDAMKAVGNMAKMALDAFTAMPAWVQTAVIGGWGLNKLTGGALQDGILGALKAVIPKMAIAAGIVQVNGPVAGGGAGVPGAPAAGGAGAGIAGKIGTVVQLGGIAAIGVGITQAMKEATDAVIPAISGGNAEQERILKGIAATARGPLESIRALPENISALADFITGGNQKTVDAVGALKSDTRSEGIAQRQALQAINSKQAASIVAFRAAERTFANQKPPQVNVSTNVKVNVTAANVTRSVNIAERYSAGPSRSVNNRGGVKVPS